MIVLAALLAVGIVLPHRLALERAAPGVAIAIWLSALTLRALSGLLVVIGVLFFLPGTEFFALLTHWCWHAVLPVIAAHLGLDGHSVGDVATLAPGALLLLSIASLLRGLFLAARSVRDLVGSTTVGPGPEGSVVIAGDDVLIAAAGLKRPRVVVTAGALTALDDAELAASLEHERGHIAGRHRFLLLYGEICGVVGRFVPGRRRALHALTFHLERHADAYAIARHDRYALASAICKVATARPATGQLMGLGGGGLTDRLRLITEESSPCSSRAARALAVGMAALVIAVGASVPAAAVVGFGKIGDGPPYHHCPT